MKICILILLGAVGVGFTDNMMERAYGEALMKSLSPALREKLEELYSDDELKGKWRNSKSEGEMAKAIKSRLTPEEITELETAYRTLILPMLQSSMEKQFGHKFPMNHLPPREIDDDYEEESEGGIDEDFLDSSERTTKRSETKSSDKGVKEEL